MLQVRALSNDYTKIPQWSEPALLNLTHLPAPELAMAGLVSTSLDEGDLEHMITATVNVSWERPHEDLDSFQAWVGSRCLGEFEEPDLIQGVVVPFEVRKGCQAHVVVLFLRGCG